MSVLIKKICHITTVHPRFDVRIFFKECLSLATTFEVYLIVADGKGDEVKNNIHIIDVSKGRSSRIGRILFTTQRAYRKALDLDCDIYHFHDPEFLFSGLKLKLKGKKVIYDVHEDVPKQTLSKSYINPLIRHILSHLIKLTEKCISRRLTAIITVTQGINKRFSGFNKQCYIINNYPDLEKFKVSPAGSLSGICYIGNISSIRGIEQILQSLDSIDTVLHLAGAFDSEEFRKKLITHKNWSKVKYYGIVDSEKAIDIIHNSLVGLVTYLPVPNHIEAQPNKMFEYMASGTPVIASDFPLWKEIIEVNRCGICVDPLDSESIAKAINYFLANLDAAKLMGRNGQNLVNEKYNWKTEKSKLLSLYASI